MIIESAKAVYTGGNIWLFYGQLNGGDFFLTTDDGYTTFFNESPENFDESLYPEWQDEHYITEISDKKESSDFCNELLDFLSAMPIEERGGLTNEDIATYRKWFAIDEDGETRTEYETHYAPSADITYIMACVYRVSDDELVRMTMASFYSGEPNDEDTEYYTKMFENDPERSRTAYYNY